MAVRDIRWGILSTGGIASRFVEDLALLDGAILAGVGSRTLEAAQTFSVAHGAEAAYGSWAELAADPSLDVIYVANPHTGHHEAARLCLEAGRAVLIEKPITLDLASAQELVSLAESKNVFLMEAMWMRTNPVIRRIRELVADGAIGEVTHVGADFGLPGPFPPEHRLRNPDLGGGALLDLGVYSLTFASLFLGTPEQVLATAALTPEGVDRNTAIALRYPGGGVATLHCGISGDTSVRATITGTAGRIEVARRFYCPNAFTLVRADVAEQVSMPLRGNGLGYEAEEVMRCLREGLLESPLVPQADTLAIMGTMDEIRAQIGVTYQPALS
jgi:predicted dehydrogenase